MNDDITAAFRQYESYNHARQAGIVNIAADAALAAFRQWMDAEGLVVVSRERADLEKAARYDVAYSHGFRAGWNAGVDNDNRTSDYIEARQAEAQRVLRGIAAAPDVLGDGP